MPSLKYFRPKTLDEALTLLEQGVPLAGGTMLTPRRHRLDAVIDLQDLGMAALERQSDALEVGAGCTLQQLIEADAFVSPALTQACRGEAAWNLRNMATLGGTMVAATGRSPVAAALLALGAEVHGLPIDRWSTVEAFLGARGADSGFRLLTRFRWPATTTLRFARVGRSPMDAPIVLVALGRAADGALRVVLGGWGPCPVRVPDAEHALASGDTSGAARAAAQACATAGDAWASAEYRADVASVLVRRLAAEEKIPSSAKDRSVGEGRDKAAGEAKGMLPREPRGTT